ncbi:MAG TPA: nickel-responsive transcriptional regulator NikR [Burkholderiaceae bacterium]
MQRFTISLDDDLARQFDAFIAGRGYDNRSEAVRDLIRTQLGSHSLGEDENPDARWCVATVSYVYDHHELTVTSRMLDLQHDHHDLVISSMHVHLDHDHCMETAVLRGPVPAVRACAQQMIALRGVRHGNVHLVLLDPSGISHHHAHDGLTPHAHLKPVN